MNTRFSLLTLAAFAAGTQFATASLGDQLLAYYDFQESGSAGLNNKAPGASSYAATRFGGGDFDASENPSGPGFSGNTDFPSSYGVTDRSQLLAGKALNLSDERNDAIVVPLGTAELGNSFTISAWHYLAAGSLSPKTRYHVFESSDTNNYDVSWGTAINNTANYLGYVASGPSLSVPGVPAGIWHHVTQVISSDGTTTRLTVYVDGYVQGSITAATSAVNFTALHFGRARAGTDDRDWDGMMDEVGIWNRALSPAEVRELYYRGQAGAGVTGSLSSLGKAYLDVGASSPALADVQGSGVYNLNEQASISVTPVPGYVFDSWTGAFSGKPANFQQTVTASTESIAQIIQDPADSDGDGLTNYQEIVVYHTQPETADSDGDGLSDGAEVLATNTDPNSSNAAAVGYINSNLATAPVGSIAISAPKVERDATNGVVTLSVPFSASLNGTTWTGLPANAPGALLSPSGNDLDVTLPVSGSGTSIFKLLIRP